MCIAAVPGSTVPVAILIQPCPVPTKEIVYPTIILFFRNTPKSFHTKCYCNTKHENILIVNKNFRNA